MLIIWRGWGIIVLPIFFAAFVAAAVLIGATDAKSPLLVSGIGAVCSVLAGFGVWLFAMRFENQPGRVFIDKATGREITVRKSAGSLFFIPTKYWAFIGGGLGLVLAIMAPNMPPPGQAHASPPATTSTSTP